MTAFSLPGPGGLALYHSEDRNGFAPGQEVRKVWPASEARSSKGRFSSVFIRRHCRWCYFLYSQGTKNAGVVGTILFNRVSSRGILLKLSKLGFFRRSVPLQYLYIYWILYSLGPKKVMSEDIFKTLQKRFEAFRKLCSEFTRQKVGVITYGPASSRTYLKVRCFQPLVRSLSRLSFIWFLSLILPSYKSVVIYSHRIVCKRLLFIILYLIQISLFYCRE